MMQRKIEKSPRRVQSEFLSGSRLGESSTSLKYLRAVTADGQLNERECHAMQCSLVV